MAASVHQRLLNKAKESSRPFNEVLQHYAIERFIYRLSVSPHADRFVLKGALMFPVWGGPSSRSTLDIDLLGKIDNGIETIVAVMKNACGMDVEDDGMSFDTHTVTARKITEDADYEGVFGFSPEGSTSRATCWPRPSPGHSHIETRPLQPVSPSSILHSQTKRPRSLSGKGSSGRQTSPIRLRTSRRSFRQSEDFLNLQQRLSLKNAFSQKHGALPDHGDESGGVNKREKRVLGI